MMKLLLSLVVTVIVAYAYYVRQAHLSFTRTPYAGNRTIAVSGYMEVFNMTFTQRFNDTNGKSMATYNIMSNVGPCAKDIPKEKRACYVPYHYHAKQTEFFEIVEGALEWYVNGTYGRTERGGKLEIPEFISHSIWNDAEQTLIFIQSVDTEHQLIEESHDTFFENMAGATNDNLHPLAQIYIVTSHDGYLGDVPHWLNVIIIRTINFIAKLLGFEANYREYTTNCDLVPGCK
jgi:uncharacterized cupin superfamily protein